MKISIENIGKVSKADIELNGITVIAGENNTGKSTVGKALYGLFNSFYNAEKHFEDDRINSINNILLDTYYSPDYYAAILARRISFSELANKLFDERSKIAYDTDLIKSRIVDDARKNDIEYDEKSINEAASRIIKVLNIDEEELIKRFVQSNLDSEFDGQINNIFSHENGVIRLTIRGGDVTVEICSDKVDRVDGRFSLHTEAIYLDDPHILDGYARTVLRSVRNRNHKYRLYNKLINYGTERKKPSLTESIVTDEHLKNIYSKLDSVCDGKLISDNYQKLSYKPYEADANLSVSNLSMGLKSFAIIKTLLQNGSLEYNGTLILDEPEIHLHPQWQLVFAELIVMISKEFKMNILMCTHSPYFLRAIEVFSEKHDMFEACKYYLAENEDNRSSVIEDVTDDLDRIYEKLGKPLQDLEDLRYSDD